MKIFKLFLLLVSLQGFSVFSQEDAISDTLYFPVKHLNAWYFVDSSQTIHEEKPHFQDVKPFVYFSDVLYLVADNGKYGIYDQSLNLIEEVKHDTILVNGNHLLLKQGKTFKQRDYLETYFQVEADSIFQRDDLVYVYKSGKIGLISGNKLVCEPTYDNIMPLNTSLFLTHNAGKFGLTNQEGKVFLPTNFDEIQLFDYGMIRFRSGEIWKYLEPASGNIIDPNGNDIHFYSNQSWKIYNLDRSKSVLYLNQGKEILNQFDDYFILQNSKIAVRQNGKIGLADEHGNLVISPKFEQVEWIADNYYQYKENDLWGLMDEAGKEITTAQYAHFLSIHSKKLFHVLNGGNVGIMNQTGKIIIPIEYDYITAYGDFFILQSNRNYGMADSSGKILSPCNFSDYNLEWSGRSSNRLVVFKQNGRYILFSKNGRVNAEPCDEYVYEFDVLKCYGTNYIDVYVISKEGKQEDYHRYNGIQSFTFTNSIENWISSSPSSFNDSYLEENQQTGLFGLRFLQKKGLAVRPKFEYVRKTAFSDMYTGKVEIDEKHFQKITGAELQTAEGGQIIFSTSGQLQQDVILNTEAFGTRWAATNTKSDMKLNTSFEMKWISGSNRYFSDQDLAENAVYIDQANDYKRIYMGGKAEICALEESDISTSDYFNYMNQMRNFWFSNEKSVQTYMNPELGIRFTGGTWKVFPVENYHLIKPKIQFSETQNFKRFKTITVNDQYLFEEAGSNNLQFVDIWSDTAKLEKLENLEKVKKFGGREAYLVTQKTNEQGKIHIGRTDFVFVADEGQIAYHDSWLIKKHKDTFSLHTNEGNIFLNHQEIKYLGEHAFAFKEFNDDGWFVLNSQTKHQFDATGFSSFKSYPNGKLLVYNGNSSAKLLNNFGMPIVSCENCTIDFDGKVILIKTARQEVFYNESGETIDTLSDGETFFGSTFITSKDKRNLHQFRLIGSEKIIPLKTLEAPQMLGKSLLVKNGTRYSLYNSEGKKLVQKSDLYEKYKIGLTGFKFSKKWEFYNQEGQLVHVSKILKNRMEQSELLMLDDGKKPYFIDYEGNIYASDSLSRPIIPIPANAIESTGFDNNLLVFEDGYSIAQKGGKYGVVDKDQNILIPFKYSNITYTGNNEFMVTLNHQQNFAGTDLKVIVPGYYEEVFIISDELYRVRRGDRFGYLRKDGSWWRMME